MRCPKCKSEIGNLSKCPYCSTVLTRFDFEPETPYDGGQSPTNFRPVNTVPVYDRMPMQQPEESGKGVLSLIGVILLGGIFLMEFLQLIFLIVA